MLPKLTRRTILVPILDADITAETVDLATALVARPDTQLVLVHVVSADEPDPHPHDDAAAADCRWRRLASAAPGRTFVEAVEGDPRTVVRAEAERFGIDTIVLGRPEARPAHARHEEPALRRLRFGRHSLQGLPARHRLRDLIV